MARPVDWSPLAESDPVPGDPGEVAVLARRYRDTATAISTAAGKLRSIASADGWVGKAAIEFRDQALSVADSVERAHDRYADTGEALAGFHPDHDEAQRLSVRALTAARNAKAAENRAQALYDDEAAKPEPDETLLTTYEQRLRDARSDFDDAQTDLDDAVATYNDAAESAAARIHDVSENDGLKTTWRDRFVSILEAVANVAGIVAAVAGILSLAVGWIPIIGQALAAALGAIALIAGVISLLANITLLAMGEGSWNSVILDAIGVLTFGIGRLFTSAAKFSSKAAKLGAWKKAMPRSTANWSRARNRLGGRLPPVGTKPGAFDAGALGDAFRGGYGGVFRDLGQLKFVWANRHAFPTTGTAFPSQAVGQFFGRASDELAHVYQVGGAHGVIHSLAGNTDLAADLAKIRSLAPTSGSPLSFANTAFTQSVISGGSWLTGSGLNIYGTTQLGK